MLGRDHLLLTLATVSLVLAPLFAAYPAIVLVALVGTAIGSLIPDADAEDAAIFHTRVRGVRGNVGKAINAIGLLYPAFGYVTRYLIYKPAVRVYDDYVFRGIAIEERHRGFLHSLLGISTATVVTGAYLVVVLAVLGLLSVALLGVFLLAYLVGALLHLLEDSCTRSGIQWHYPFRTWRVRGTLRTSPKVRDALPQRAFLLVLAGVAVVLFLIPPSYPAVPPALFAALGALIGALLWAGFALVIAGCEVA